MKKVIYVALCFMSVLLLASCNFDFIGDGSDNDVTIDEGGNNNQPNDENDTGTKDESTENPDEGNGNGSGGYEDLVVDVEAKEKRELFVTIPKERPMKVLQLADIHFGIEGKDWHNDKVERTKQYINAMVEEQTPDLIVCSGDNILGTGVKGLTEFIEMMENYRTPWIWLYGNHDAESTATSTISKKNLSKKIMETNTEYLLYKEGYCEPGYEDRYGNFSVNIYDNAKEKLLGAFVILDAGEYDYNLGQYKAITTGQINWYKGEIDRLQAIYSTQGNNEYEVIPTVVFSHIQLPEYHTAYIKAVEKDGAEFVIEQELSDSDIKEIKTGGPEVNNGFFDVMVEKGSTKAYFVGHAHTFYFQVKYQGIVLGFGPQTGFSKLFANNDAARKTYMYNIASDLTFTTTKIDEVVRDKGLVYTGTSAGHAKYNEAAGTYTFTVQLTTWNRVSLDYYGPELTEEYTRLTLENTTVTGEINTSTAADWTSKLYCSSIGSGVYICSSSQSYNYRFTYTVATNTLHIELVGELDMESGSITADKANRDSELSIWKKAGSTMITDSSYATADGKRLFIIIDAEGKIAYSVYNHTDENGNPTLEEAKYYCHPDYVDDENPAIVITETGYKIVIPEGGFAITADGDGIVKLAKLLINPSITSNKGLEDIINNLDAYNDDLRLSYDSDTKVIFANYN